MKEGLYVTFGFYIFLLMEKVMIVNSNTYNRYHLYNISECMNYLEPQHVQYI